MESLKAGNHIIGPAIIESDATTFVVPDGFETTIDKHRLFHLKEVQVRRPTMNMMSNRNSAW
jgi:acetone carboxylase beta subunit